MEYDSMTPAQRLAEIQQLLDAATPWPHLDYISYTAALEALIAAAPEALRQLLAVAEAALACIEARVVMHHVDVTGPGCALCKLHDALNALGSKP